MNITETIQKELFSLQDKQYLEFQGGLIPTVDPASMIGVRTPELRALAKKCKKEDSIGTFLSELPHKYFEENQLHAFIISETKDYESCIKIVNEFLPYVDNWATCDQMSPKVFKKYKNELLKEIKKWLRSDRTYTVRFGIKMLMTHYLDDDYKPEYTRLVTEVRSEEYYINMMIAWYLATALAKQWDSVIPIIEENKLDIRTHNKAIQKSVESNRITPEQKTYLRSLKRKGK